MRRSTDRVFLTLTGMFVAGLAVVAGAISFAHMVELAQRHDQSGWKAYAFPVSVDGLEIVASLYLVAQRRAGRPTGLIPWVALVVGTLASLTANVAVGGHDVIGKALAGWPAVSMLVAVKLFFSMFDHVHVDEPAVRDDRGRLDDTDDTSRTVQDADGEDAASSGTVVRDRPDGVAGLATRSTEQVDVRAVAHLIPAARAAGIVVTGGGRSLSRDALARAMRNDGQSVSNVHASLLLKILKAEESVARLTSSSGPTRTETRQAEELHRPDRLG